MIYLHLIPHFSYIFTLCLLYIISLNSWTPMLWAYSFSISEYLIHPSCMSYLCYTCTRYQYHWCQYYDVTHLLALRSLMVLLSMFLVPNGGIMEVPPGGVIQYELRWRPGALNLKINASGIQATFMFSTDTEMNLGMDFIWSQYNMNWDDVHTGCIELEEQCKLNTGNLCLVQIQRWISGWTLFGLNTIWTEMIFTLDALNLKINASWIQATNV